MTARIYLLVTALSALIGASSPLEPQEKCGLETVKSQEINLYFNSRRDAKGKWQTTFSVHTDATHNSSDEGMSVDLKQVVIKCGDKELLQVHGVIGQDAVVHVNSKKTEKLYFVKGGDNVEFTNDRRTLTKKTRVSDGNKGSAITNRPLNDNELFEVTLDAMKTKWINGIMLGLTTIIPSDIKFADNLLDIKCGTLIYFSESIYQNGTTAQAEYGAKIYQLKDGAKIGVMRKGDGAVHFFVNGIDQGAVKTTIRGNVYGVVDLYTEVTKVTIVNPI